MGLNILESYTEKPNNVSKLASVAFVLGTVIPAISLADYLNIPNERIFSRV